MLRKQITMTDSQMFFWFGISAVTVWVPILALVWFFKSEGKGPSPWGALRADVKDGLTVIVDKWPEYKPGQKHFMIATSFSIGAIVLVVAWAGKHAAQWASIVYGGMSVEEAVIQPPLGSWITTWLVQSTLIVCFYVWLEFRPKNNIDQSAKH